MAYTLGSGYEVETGDKFDVVADIPSHRVPEGAELTIGEIHKHHGRMVIHYEWGHSTKGGIKPHFMDILLMAKVVVPVED